MRIAGHGGRMPRLIAALVLLALPAAGTAVVAPRAYAVDTSKGTPGYCPDANGVTVVIDFQELGGTTIVRCARGDQATGHAALKNAGIEITGAARWGEAFVCRIEGKPGANSEPCIDTPPASAYWSYWHSPNGGSWTYSQWGVLNRKPPAGSFEGWSFAKNKTETTNPPPRVAPSRPAAATPDAPDAPGAKNPPPAAGNGGGSGSGGTSAASGGNSAPGGRGSTAAGAGPNGTGASGTDPLAPGPGVSGNPMEAEPPPAAPASEVPAATPTEYGAAGPGSAAPSGQPSGVTPQGQTWTGGEESATRKRDGVPTTTIVGIALLVAICAAAGFTTWRRRARADGSG